MKKRSRLLVFLLLAVLFTFISPAALAAPPDKCSIGAKKYDDLSKAVRDILSGKEKGDIVLNADCELTVNSISAPVSIVGNAHTVHVKIPGNESFNIMSKLSFDNTVVSFDNPKAWSAMLGGSGVLELKNKSVCSFEKNGVYASPNAQIILDASRMSFKNILSTAMTAPEKAKLSIKNGSEFSISERTELTGITGFQVTVDTSTLSVTDCLKQGLVKCDLILENGAKANISRNATGFNLFSGNILTVGAGTTLTMDDNAFSAILVQGSGGVNVDNGGHFYCRGNGGRVNASDEKDGGKAAINIGWFSAEKIYNTGALNFSDGADVLLSDNYVRALSNYGKSYLGSGTVIQNNGRGDESENISVLRIERGGGINNHGALALGANVILCGNHATVAGDDLSNADGCPLSLSPAALGQTLNDDEGHKITGWFEDNEGSRWSAHKKPIFVQSKLPGQYTSALSLKAAHGFYPVTADVGESIAVLSVVMLLSISLAYLVLKRLRRQSL